MDLTQEHFDKAINNLATRADIEEIKSETAAIKEVLASQTNALDQVVKQTKDWNTEMVMVRARLDRHDQWFKKLAEKVNVKLEA
jgi:hypothetical protein